MESHQGLPPTLDPAPTLSGGCPMPAPPSPLVAPPSAGLRAGGYPASAGCGSPAGAALREILVAPGVLAYCLHVTLGRRLRDLAPGLTPRSVLEKFAAVQMKEDWPEEKNVGAR